MKLTADFHSHSHYSRDSVLAPDVYIETSVRRGLTCIAVTDHNEIEGARVIQRLAAKKEAALKVIIGEEVKSSEGEIIGLFLKDLVPRGLSPEDTVRAIHEQDGVAIVPHPFDIFRRSVITKDALDRIVHSIDAIEGYNCRNILAKHDAKAREVAANAGKPFSVGSDSHSRWELGGVRMEMDAFDTPAEFVASLKTGRVTFRRSLPMVHWISTYAKIRWRLGKRPDYAGNEAAWFGSGAATQPELVER